MDIPPSLTKSLNSGQKQSAESSPAAALAKALGIHPNHKIEASVSQISRIVGKEQQELINFHASNKSLPAKLQQQFMEMLSSPQLKLVALEIKGKTLNSLSDLNLTIEQKIFAKVTPQGQLMLLLEEAAAPTKQAGLSAQSNPTIATGQKHINPRLQQSSGALENNTDGRATPTQAESAKSTAHPPKRFEPLPASPSIAQRKTETASISPKGEPQLSQPVQKPQPAISDAANVKPRLGVNLLPSSFEGAQPKTAISNTNNNLFNSAGNHSDRSKNQAEPLVLTSSQKKLISQTMAQLIGRTPESTTKIMDSLLKVTPLMGEFAQEIKATKPALFPDTTLLAIKNLLSQPLRPQHALQMPQRILNALHNSGVLYEQKIAVATDGEKHLSNIEQDLKWQLQQISTLAHTPNNRTFQEQSYDKLLQTLFLLLTPNKAANKKNMSQKESIVSDLKLLIGTLANKALGKLQLNQYQNLAQKQSESSVFQTEIPIRLADHIVPVKFEIREKLKPEDSEEEDNKRRKKKKVSRWSVFLEMDLSEDDVLAANIDILEDNLSLKFWANSEKLRDKTRKDMRALQSELQDSGITVNEIHCTNDNPPTKESSIDWNLIDIQT